MLTDDVADVDRTWLLSPFVRSVLAAAGLSLLFVVWMGFEIGGDTITRTFDNMTEFIVAVAAGGTCLTAARTIEGRYGLGWRLLGVSAMAWGAGQAVWSYYELIRGVDVPFPSLADAGFLLAVPLAVCALASFTSTLAVSGRRLRNLLDGMIVAGSVLALGWVTALGGAFHDATGSVLAQVISLAYPLGDVVIGTMAILILVRAPVRSRSAMALIAAGLLALAVSDTAFAYLTQIGRYGSSNNLLDTGWVVGYLLIGLAALQASVPSPDAGREVPAPAPSRLRMLVPYIPLVLATGATLVKVRTGGVGPFLGWTMAVIAALVLLRQVCILFENATLIAELQANKRELEELAFHDGLTGLANRLLFWDRVGIALQRSHRSRSTVGLLMCDLDDFKHINDTLGHAAGDSLLIAVAIRLRGCVRPGDTPARVGGDEFAIMVDAADQPDVPVQIAHRIIDAMRAPFRIDDTDVVASMSIGLAHTDDPRMTVETFLRKADGALYLAKHLGKARFEVSDQIAPRSSVTH